MIKKIKIALMEKDLDNPTDKENNEAFIIRSSATFDPNLYWEKTYRDSTPDKEASKQFFENFLSSSIDLIFRELKESVIGKYSAGFVGMWIETDEGKFDNSMDISLMEEMGKYAAEEIVPIYELYKMTLVKNESTTS